MQNSIFGVDINEEAIRVASFSLSLAMCDFLDPRSIWDKLSFPRLLENNLTSSDFFDKDKFFNSKKYDIIIGNPPWQSNITEKTKAYLKESEDKFLEGLTKMAARKIPAAIVFMRI